MPSTLEPARRSSRAWRWMAVVAYMGFIFFLSAQSSLPELPGHPSDKLEHSSAYGILGLLVVWALADGRIHNVTFRHVVIAVAISSAYGYSDEVHQLFVPNRTYDLLDWLADTTGASVAAVGTWAWGILLRGRERRHGI
jgi:VanZ family protein